MKTLGFMLSATLLLTGCGKQIKDLVSVAAPIPVPTTVVSINSTKAFKLSPGHVDSHGSSVGASLTITPTRRVIKGARVEARVSLQQSRTK